MNWHLSLIGIDRLNATSPAAKAQMPGFSTSPLRRDDIRDDAIGPGVNIHVLGDKHRDGPAPYWVTDVRVPCGFCVETKRRLQSNAA